MTLALYAIEQSMHIHVTERIRPSPLRVEIGAVLGHVGQGIIDRVIETLNRIGGKIFDSDPGVFAERHLPIAVESTGWVHCNRQRCDIAARGPAVAKEITDRSFYRRRVLAIPITAENETAPMLRMNGQPDVLD